MVHIGETMISPLGVYCSEEQVLQNIRWKITFGVALKCKFATSRKNLELYV
jgi:hypothetical protein